MATNNRAKQYVLTDPAGQQQSITNLSQFCKDNNLNPKRMYDVARGAAANHKGWGCFKAKKE